MVNEPMAKPVALPFFPEHFSKPQQFLLLLIFFSFGLASCETFFPQRRARVGEMDFESSLFFF